MSDQDEINRLMNELDVPDCDDDDSEAENMDPEEALEKYRREVTIDDHAVDKIILGSSDLDKAVEQFESLTGVKPVWVKSLNCAGVKSARVTFESCCYLEIVGPDPKQDSETALSAALSKLPANKLVPVHYAIRHAGVGNRKPQWQDLKLEYDQITMVEKDRHQPWLHDMYLFKLGNGLAPIFTDWKDAAHASSKLPIVGTLSNVTVSAPENHAVHNLVKEQMDKLDIEKGAPTLSFTFKSPKGSHTFSCADPIGISFPDDGGIPVSSFE